MALDPVVNFFRSQIATLPVASGGTVIVLPTGDGNKLPNPATDGAFNLTIYNADDPFVTPEIVRVTGRSGDTLTVTRAQEGTTATNKTAGSTWSVELTPTAKTIQDIDSKKVEKTGDTMTGTLTATKLIPSGNVTAGNGMYLPAANTVAVSTNGVERYRVDSSGNVGIGTTAPATKLHLDGGSSAPTYTLSRNLSVFPGAIGLISFLNTNNGINLAVIQSQTEGAINTGNLIFNTTNAGSQNERLRITGAGNVGIGTTAPATKLDVVGSIRASVGILFGTDTASANTLSDYEQGTFTPTYSPSSGSFSSITYGDQIGKYTKIGNKVTVSIRISTTALSIGSATSELRISGLPFSSVGGGDPAVSMTRVIGWGGDFPSAGDISSNIVVLRYRTSVNGATILLEPSDMSVVSATNQNALTLTATYFTS
jgi:hypothetical protein